MFDFVTAVAANDTSRLVAIMKSDVRFVSDGGGKAPAALRIVGPSTRGSFFLPWGHFSQRLLRIGTVNRSTTVKEGSGYSQSGFLSILADQGWRTLHPSGAHSAADVAEGRTGWEGASGTSAPTRFRTKSGNGTMKFHIAVTIALPRGCSSGLWLSATFTATGGGGDHTLE